MITLFGNEYIQNLKSIKHDNILWSFENNLNGQNRARIWFKNSELNSFVVSSFELIDLLLLVVDEWSWLIKGAVPLLEIPENKKPKSTKSWLVIESDLGADASRLDRVALINLAADFVITWVESEMNW